MDLHGIISSDIEELWCLSHIVTLQRAVRVIQAILYNKMMVFKKK